MKRVILALALVPLLVGLAGATPVGPGDVSGIWAAADSPFIVGGHITVPSGQTLTIESGVEVRFDGNYVLRVEGIITASGAEGDSIYFRPHVPGTTWGHIEIPAGADGGSGFSYCRIEGANSLDNLPPHSTHGGGLHMAAGSSLLLNSSIEWCVGEDGGGLFMQGSVWAQDCVIRHCEAGGNGTQEEGGGVYMGGVANLNRCIVSENTANFGGGGVFARIFSGEISDCIIVGNSVEGHGGGVGLQTLNPGALVSGNLIAGNDCGSQWYSDGGGVYFWSAYAGTFESNTIVDNTAPEGAGIAYGHAVLTVHRCMIAFNHGSASYDISGDTNITFTQNCVWGNSGGDLLVGSESETVNLDPLFCDASSGDYTLCADSPCLPLSIGAFGEGCAACQTTTEASSWSRVKSLY